MSIRYEVRLRRIGRWWAVDIPVFDVHTQCRTLDGAEETAREAIAGALGVPPDSIAVELVIPEVTSLLEDAHSVADAARTLIEELGASQSEACRLLGLSHEEVSVLSPARESRGSRPWRLDPASALAVTGGGTRSPWSGGGTQHPVRPAAANASPESLSPMPERPRQASFTPPSWAIREDDA